MKDQWDDLRKKNEIRRLKMCRKRARTPFCRSIYSFFLQLVRPGESWDEVIARFKDIIVQNVLFSGRLGWRFGLPECRPGEAADNLRDQPMMAMSWITQLGIDENISCNNKYVEEMEERMFADPPEPSDGDCIDVSELKQEAYDNLGYIVRREEGVDLGGVDVLMAILVEMFVGRELDIRLDQRYAVLDQIAVQFGIKPIAPLDVRKLLERTPELGYMIDWHNMPEGNYDDCHAPGKRINVDCLNNVWIEREHEEHMKRVLEAEAAGEPFMDY